MEKELKNTLNQILANQVVIYKELLICNERASKMTTFKDVIHTLKIESIKVLKDIQ